MTDPASPGGPMLSVRGEARQVVVPDYVILAGAIAFSRESKAEAVRAAASGLDRLTAGLTALGAVALDVESERHPLTWSAQAASRTRHPWTRSRRSCPPPSKPVSPPLAFRCLRRMPRPGADPAGDQSVSRGRQIPASDR